MRLHLTFTLSSVSVCGFQCQYIAKHARSMMQHERAASSDSAAIMRGDNRLNRTLLFYFLGVAPTPSGSGITKLGAPYATRGQGELRAIIHRAVQLYSMLFDFKLIIIFGTPQ